MALKLRRYLTFASHLMLFNDAAYLIGEINGKEEPSNMSFDAQFHKKQLQSLKERLMKFASLWFYASVSKA